MKKNIALILIFLFATNAIFGFISTNIDFNDVAEASYIDNKPIYNATAPTTGRNKGRLVVGDMNIVFSTNS